MAERFVAPSSIKLAVTQLRGTADAMLKVWLTLKHMGLKEDAQVVVDTETPEVNVNRLFGYGGERLFVPFATIKSDLRMSKEAARSQIQSNVKKFHDGTVGYDPRSYLRISQRPDRKWEVALQDNYPQGLGYGKSGFARAEGQRVALPIRAWAVWYGRQTPIPDAASEPIDYLVHKMITELNIDRAERAVVFRDDPEFVPNFVSDCISDIDLRALVEEMVDAEAPEAPVYDVDERSYLRKLFSVRTSVAGPKWLRDAPTTKLRGALNSGAKAVLLYGPPRTGKTRAIDAIVPRNSPSRITIQIHDGWGYEHLMLGMKADGATFDWADGPLLKAIREKREHIVLDEANRTHLSQALGEVFSLLENKYRGEEHAQTLVNGSKLFIPEGVTFFFTLNTLDNSTEEIDDALLGRVAAVEFPPRVEDLRDMLASQGLSEGRVDRIAEFFVGVLSKYPLGHGYFAPVRSDTELLRFYESHIRPVLQKRFQYDAGALTDIDLLADEFMR